MALFFLYTVLIIVGIILLLFILTVVLSFVVFMESKKIEKEKMPGKQRKHSPIDTKWLVSKRSL